jgi:hypothetical protein
MRVLRNIPVMAEPYRIVSSTLLPAVETGTSAAKGYVGPHAPKQMHATQQSAAKKVKVGKCFEE